MQLPITRKVLDHLTTGAGTVAGIPQIISGIGVSNYSSLIVENGTQYSFFFSFDNFSIEKIALGCGTLLLGFVFTKDTK